MKKKTAQEATGIKDYGIDVLGRSGSRWKGMGSVTLQSGETVVYVGDDKVQQGGVAIKMGARAKRALIDWTPISKRIVKARFYSRQKKLTVIQTYAGHSIKLQLKRHDCGDR